MFTELKARVFEQNQALVKHGLVVLSWGNVSAIDRDAGLMAIKPSGVSYENMTADDIVLIDVVSKKSVGGKQRPSRDTLTHLYLYENFPLIGGIVHTHSTHAMAFAQAGESIPAFGVTHAGYFNGDIPCSRDLTKAEMGTNYELSVGKVIVETAVKAGTIPAALVKAHGPFVWGETPEKAVENAIVLEEIAKAAILTRLVNPSAATLERHILDRYNVSRK